MIFRAHLNLCDYLSVFVCLLRSLANGVNEPENEDVGGEYREFNAEELDC
jgi:hypothetical protein